MKRGVSAERTLFNPFADRCAFLGHTRPICSLAARLVKSGPVNVTFFTTMSFYDRVSAELVRNFDVHDVNTRERIR